MGLQRRPRLKTIDEQLPKLRVSELAKAGKSRKAEASGQTLGIVAGTMIDSAPMTDFMFRVMDDAHPTFARDREAWQRAAHMMTFVDLPDTSTTPAESYAFAINNQVLKLNAATVNLRLCAQAIGLIQPGTKGFKQSRLFDLLRYNLIVHRTMIVALRDGVLRLIASVMDLGIPEKALTNTAIVTQNRNLTKAVNDAWKRVEALAAPWVGERNDIGHAGGVPTVPEFPWEEAMKELQRVRFDEIEQVLQRHFETARARTVAAIEKEIQNFEEIEAELHEALMPIYEQRHAALSATK